MNDNLDILFAGDFAPCGRFEEIASKKKEAILGDAIKWVDDADISFVNLECPLTDCDLPIEKKGPNLKASPRCIDSLKPFSIIGLANNHILDYGAKGLMDTIAQCKLINKPTVGAGCNLEEAQKHRVIEEKGVRVAFIALAEHEFNQASESGAGSAPMDAIDNYDQIAQAKEHADIVIVSLHAGNEYFIYPRPKLRKICRFFIDIGADTVICHHPHVPGTYEYYNGKPIFYSIGNFVFDRLTPPNGWNEGYMVNLSFDITTMNLVSVDIIPYQQSVELGGVRLLKDLDKKKFLQLLEEYSSVLKEPALYYRKWTDFISEKSDSYILQQYFPFVFRGIGFLGRRTPLAKLFINKWNVMAKLNMIRCQSHLEVLVSSLEKKK